MHGAMEIPLDSLIAPREDVPAALPSVTRSQNSALVLPGPKKITQIPEPSVPPAPLGIFLTHMITQDCLPIGIHATLSDSHGRPPIRDAATS